MEHQHHHQTHHSDHQNHEPSADPDQLRFLDLDAEVFGNNLTEVLTLSGVSDLRAVVDLGAGTGTGSRLLREAYPKAAITCVDNDATMLDVLQQQGFAVVKADLEEGFPTLTGSAGAVDEPVDLVWASSSLHHVAHPARLLSGVGRALAPSGVLIVVELAGLPRFLKKPADSSLELRCHVAAAAEGWNHYPDWTPVIEAAGFTVTKSEVTSAVPVTSAAREYAQQWFSRFQHLMTLAEEDRNAVQDLLRHFPELELEPRTTRTVWVARLDPSQVQQ